MGCPDWLRANMKKSGSTNAGPKTQPNIRDTGSPFHKVKGYADGGEVEAMKQEGLKASAGEKVGFFERLRAGNIDDPNSEAYRRFGAGRGMADRQERMRDEAMADAFKTAKPAETKSEPETRDMDSSQQTTKPAAKPKPAPRVVPDTRDMDESQQRSKPAEKPAETTKGRPGRAGRRPGFFESLFSGQPDNPRLRRERAELEAKKRAEENR